MNRYEAKANLIVAEDHDEQRVILDSMVNSLNSRLIGLASHYRFIVNESVKKYTIAVVYSGNMGDTGSTVHVITEIYSSTSREPKKYGQDKTCVYFYSPNTVLTMGGGFRFIFNREEYSTPHFIGDMEEGNRMVDRLIENVNAYISEMDKFDNEPRFENCKIEGLNDE